MRRLIAALGLATVVVVAWAQAALACGGYWYQDCIQHADGVVECQWYWYEG